MSDLFKIEDVKASRGSAYDTMAEELFAAYDADGTNVKAFKDTEKAESASFLQRLNSTYSDDMAERKVSPRIITVTSRYKALKDAGYKKIVALVKDDEPTVENGESSSPAE